jgi:hypothetical protein
MPAAFRKAGNQDSRKLRNHDQKIGMEDEDWESARRKVMEYPK